ncbi:hypothetical protein FTO74_00550 [Granulicella sp. WH15]|uniref:hypothetical protein n=1 Tax=Granulicella sp. WH15 TaxID=2602070 RepID=UPI0013671DC3|nr:hypothetical protein [Granulicella sp. WH15]QHN02036.1 hypothetical protein FTO74_00550 [Granulicella sp. WH15]
MRTNQAVAALAMLTAAGLAVGCRVDEHKSAGGGENVKIATPFGGMTIKTADNVVAGVTGLDVYPGAQPVKKAHDEEGAADVNMSFGRFSLRVKAATYRTTDSPEKVQTFYRTSLAKFGSILTCSGDKPVGTPTRTPEGLTCDHDSGNHVVVNANEGKPETGKINLKVGSRQHQHIVSIRPENGGTRFELVALDLPGQLSFSDDDADKDSDKDKAERKQ